jgi:stringent starvation protein B
MVRVDARRSGVQVPRQFSEESGLPLNLSWAFRDARMALNERGVAATLTFGGVPFRCLLPWSAIWGIRVAKGGSLQIWETDLPVELGGTEPPPLVDEMPVEPRPRLVKLPSAEEAAAATPSSSEAAVAPAPSLSVAPPDAPTAAEAPAAQPPPAAPSVSRPPWLRLVR